MGVNRRRSICNDLNTRVAQLQIVFAYYFFTFDWFRSSRLVSIEGDRRLEGSSAQHANVYLRSRRIHVWDMWRTYIDMGYVEDIYRVCLRSIRMDVTYRLEYRVRYIYLISVILNVYGGYGLCYNSLTACLLYLFHIRIYR